jgi:hypothetical protein
VDEKIIFAKSIHSLFDWVKKEDYCGWDPYDALHSHLTTKMCMGNPYLEILLTQINRISPINMRPFLKIEKGIDLKGSALFARAFSEMYKMTKEEEYHVELNRVLYFIRNESLKNRYSNECWASHYFRYRGADKSQLTQISPDIIGTSQSIIALVEGYKITNDEYIKNTAINAWNFVLNNFIHFNQDKVFIKYDLAENNRMVINASAQGLEAGNYILTIWDNEETKYICQKLADSLVSAQEIDGSWKYSVYSSGKVRNQLDFHQGFILDALLEYLPNADDKAEILCCIDKGIRFYREKMFLNDGRSYYRYPMKYPVEIHNQAQGIITFSKYGALCPQYLEFAQKIAQWTINKMQDISGYFYYQKWPLIINKIPYMRWNQAWMMLALSVYLKET